MQQIKDKGLKLAIDLVILVLSVLVFFFQQDMLFFHFVVIIMVIVTILKCFYSGLKSGSIRIAVVAGVTIISMLFKQGIGVQEVSELFLFVVPTVLVGIMADSQRLNSQRMKETYLSTLQALAEAIDARDPYTAGHSERVAKISCAIANKLNFTDEDMETLRWSALLHDIGKIALSDDILRKTGKLDNSDWVEIKRHPTVAKKILESLDFLSPSLVLILQHHRRPDGYGYPNDFKNEEILIGARILAVADAFDAMISVRPYRESFTVEAALKELKNCSGKQLDLQLVKIFEEIIRNESSFWEKVNKR